MAQYLLEALGTLPRVLQTVRGDIHVVSVVSSLVGERRVSAASLSLVRFGLQHLPYGCYREAGVSISLNHLPGDKNHSVALTEFQSAAALLNKVHPFSFLQCLMYFSVFFPLLSSDEGGHLFFLFRTL